MKQYPSGFVPANFNSVGKMFLVLGVLSITLKGLDLLTDMINLPNMVLYFGIGCLIVSAYLIFVVPKDE